MTDWAAALDALEQRLDAESSALAAGGLAPPVAFRPPQVSTPVPPHLVHRATELVWRCRDLDDALAAALASVAELLERAAEPSSAPAQPVYFDSRV